MPLLVVLDGQTSSCCFPELYLAIYIHTRFNTQGDVQYSHGFFPSAIASLSTRGQYYDPFIILKRKVLQFQEKPV